MKFLDDRGILLFPIKNNDDYNFNQCTISINKKNVFRGIHVNTFNKLVTCIKGKILDIVINFDKDAVDYLKPKYYELNPDTDFFQLFIHKNHGHAFLSLQDDSILVYHFDDIYTDENTYHINYLDPLLNIQLPIKSDDIILSKKDSASNFIKPIDFLILGASGFLGSNIIKILDHSNKNYIKCNLRLEKNDEIEKYINIIKPKNIINCAGLTGTPNIFWCDDNKIKTIETNIIYQMTLAKICKDNNIHLTILGSGGIFENDRFYNEEDEGNFNKNFYSKSRICLENMIKNYDNVLCARINYPICNDASDKNLLTKLLSYKNIENVELSITYIDDLFPILIDMICNNEVGICNLVNEGSISLLNIMKIYNNYKTHSYDIAEVISPNRSYSKLSIGKLKKYNVMNISDAIETCIKKYILNSFHSTI